MPETSQTAGRGLLPGPAGFRPELVPYRHKYHSEHVLPQAVHIGSPEPVLPRVPLLQIFVPRGEQPGRQIGVLPEFLPDDVGHHDGLLLIPARARLQLAAEFLRLGRREAGKEPPILLRSTFLSLIRSLAGPIPYPPVLQGGFIEIAEEEPVPSERTLRHPASSHWFDRKRRGYFKAFRAGYAGNSH